MQVRVVDRDGKDDSYKNHSDECELINPERFSSQCHAEPHGHGELHANHRFDNGYLPRTQCLKIEESSEHSHNSEEDEEEDIYAGECLYVMSGNGKEENAPRDSYEEERLATSDAPHRSLDAVVSESEAEHGEEREGNADGRRFRGEYGYGYFLSV